MTGTTQAYSFGWSIGAAGTTQAWTPSGAMTGYAASLVRQVAVTAGLTMSDWVNEWVDWEGPGAPATEEEVDDLLREVDRMMAAVEGRR